MKLGPLQRGEDAAPISSKSLDEPLTFARLCVNVPRLGADKLTKFPEAAYAAISAARNEIDFSCRWELRYDERRTLIKVSINPFEAGKPRLRAEGF